MIGLLAGDLSRAKEAVEASGLPLTSLKALGKGADIDCIVIKCPVVPSKARTAMYLMHYDKADALVYIGDTKDDEIINLMQSKPIYIHYIQPDYVVGLRLNWEEEDF